MSDRFTERMTDKRVAHDVNVLADFIVIWCDAHHADAERRSVESPASALGVYGTHVPVLCAECEEHLTYAEKRRALCPKEPKPFCAHCDTHCYKPDERVWQQEMMRFSGPRSWSRGHALDGIRHLIEGRKYRKAAARSGAAAQQK